MATAAAKKKAKKPARTKTQIKQDNLKSKQGQIDRKAGRLTKLEEEIITVRRELRDLEVEFWEISTDRESLAG